MRYFTVAQAARELQVHRTTITRWIRSGRLKASRVGPESVRIKEADLQQVITSANDTGREVTGMKERQAETFSGYAAPRALTDDEIERLLEDLRQFRERVLAERGGKRAPDSTEIIREERERRSSQLAGP